MLTWLVFPLLGTIVGVLSGLVGIGGGIVLVPMLAMILPFLNINSEVAVHLALGTSLACASFTLWSSSITHRRHGNFEKKIFHKFLPGIILGAIMSPYIVHLLPAAILRTVIGIVLLLLAINIVVDYEIPPSRKLPGTVVLVLSSLIIGLLSAFAGLSGAVLITPYLMWFGVSMRKALGTAAMCGLLLAMVGMVSYMVVGYNIPNLPVGAVGYVYWPAVVFISITSVPAAQIAARMSTRLPKEFLKRLLAMVLTLVASKMLFFW